MSLRFLTFQKLNQLRIEKQNKFTVIILQKLGGLSNQFSPLNKEILIFKSQVLYYLSQFNLSIVFCIRCQQKTYQKFLNQELQRKHQNLWVIIDRQWLLFNIMKQILIDSWIKYLRLGKKRGYWFDGI